MMIFRRSLAEVWTSAGSKRNQYTVCVDDLLSLRRCLQNVKKMPRDRFKLFQGVNCFILIILT